MMKISTKLMMLFLLTWIFASCAENNNTHLLSPNNQQQLFITNNDGNIHYTLVSWGDTVVKNSKLGFFVEKSFKMQGIEKSSYDETWEPVYGQFNEIRNHYNQIKLRLVEESGIKMNLYARIFNDGVAFRYEFPEQPLDSIALIDYTSYNFIDNHTIWFAEQHDGWNEPESVSINDHQFYATPATVKINDELYASIREAALKNCSRMFLTRTGKNTLESTLDKHAFLYDRLWIKRIDELQSPQDKESVALPYLTPWRTITTAKQPGGLIESNLVLNLNDPPEGDFSWVKTGKAFWDFRVRGGTIGGHKYCGDKLTTGCCKHYIDKAAYHGIDYFTIDANWYGREHDPESNPVTDAPGIDIQEVIDYGKKKGVGIWLYINDIAFQKHDPAKIFKAYNEWGAVGIKHGFLQRNGLAKVRYAQKILDLCAQNHLLYVQHEGFNPAGIQRTYPNYFGVENGYTQMDARLREQINYLPEEIMIEKRKVPDDHRAAEKIVPPSYYTIQPFTTLLTGPKDFCPGIFDCNDAHVQGRLHFNSPIPSTINNQLALCNLYNSGVINLMDAPESYEQYPELFEFVKNIPIACDETIVLKSEIGDFIVFARRKDDQWFISGVTDENAREMNLKMDFLGDGIFNGKYYADDPECSYLGEKEKYHIDNLTGISSSSSLKIKMVPGGGFNVWLIKNE